jgi:hypothetical protein
MTFKLFLNGLPVSQTDWHASMEMINGRFGENPHPQIGDTEIGFYADHCHMNCYQYLLAWIHFAS